MERNKALLISVIAGLTVVGGLIIYDLVTPPTYNEMLAHIESLMNANNNVSIQYLVEFDSNNQEEPITGFAYFSRQEESVSWNNTVMSVEGTFYDLRPYDLINFMSYAESYTVEDYQSDIPCIMLNSLVSVDAYYDFFMDEYEYARIMACFDKETGYPLQYTMMVIGDVEGYLVSYNSVGVRTGLLLEEYETSKPVFNKSSVGSEVWENATSIYEEYVASHQ